MEKKINLNEIVVVEFTERGKKIYTKYENEINRITKMIFPKIKRTKKKLNGKLEFQLWQLFNIFGSSIDLGNSAVFINNVITFK